LRALSVGVSWSVCIAISFHVFVISNTR
jgi:hypothetical protein